MAIRSQDPEDPQFYAKSRAALRDLYGSRKIDARTHISEADSTPSARMARQTGIVDTTPSGRMREYRERGLTEDQSAQRSGDYWKSLFKTQPQASPLGSATPKASMPQTEGSGMFDALIGLPKFVPAPTPSWEVQGNKALSLAPTVPPDPATLQSQLGLIPSSNPLYDINAPRRLSVMSGANKWIQPV